MLGPERGFMIPGLPSPKPHDIHHVRFNKNYGTLGLLDLVYGTAASEYSKKL